MSRGLDQLKCRSRHGIPRHLSPILQTAAVCTSQDLKEANSSGGNNMGSRIRGITSLLAKRVAAKPALSVNGVAGPSRAFSLVSKRLPAPIGSSKAGETSRSTFQHPGPVTFRPLHTSSPNGARYERFDGPSSAGPSGSDGGGGGRPDFLAFFRRRLGSDRAVWIYGIGVGGAVIYYVIQ